MQLRLESGKICKNNDHTCLFCCINNCRVPRQCLNTLPNGLVFKQHCLTQQMLMHQKTCVIPVFLQTVKTQMKCQCGISSGSALFAKANGFSEKEIQYYLASMTYDPMIYTKDQSDFTVSNFIEKSYGLKRFNFQAPMSVCSQLDLWTSDILSYHSAQNSLKAHWICLR